MARHNKTRTRRKLRKLQDAMDVVSQACAPTRGGIKGNAASVQSARSNRQKKIANSQELTGSNTFLAFVLTTPTGDFRFPSFRDRGSDAIYTSWGLTQQFSHMNEDMLEIWKRVAVDQALEFDDTVNPTSLRLVRVKTVVEDATHELFDEKSDFEHHQKLSVVGRLSDRESKLLGLAKERAIYKISANPDQHVNDRKLLRSLGDFGDDVDSTSLIDVLRRR